MEERGGTEEGPAGAKYPRTLSDNRMTHKMGFQAADDREGAGAVAALSQVLSADRKTQHLVLSWEDIEFLESVNKAITAIARVHSLVRTM